MGAFKILSSLLMIASIGFSEVVYWKEKTIEVKVPKNSVVTIELPCKVEGVFVNNSLNADYEGNGVFVSVGETPSSLGISCKKGEVYRSYSLYLFPSRKGVVYLKIEDEKLKREYLRSRMKERVEGEVSSGSLMLEAEELTRAILKGEIPQGYEVVKASSEAERIGGFEVRKELVYVGRELVGVVFRVRNSSYMQKKLEKDMFFGKGVVFVYLEREGWIPPDEEVKGVVVKLKGAVKGKRKGTVLPYKEGS